MSFIDSLPTELQDKIKKITTILPNSLEIFQELYDFGIAQGGRQNGVEQNFPKKRKLNDTLSDDGRQSIIAQDNIIFKLKEISVLSPLRKKLNLVLHLSHIDNKPVLSLEKDSKIELSISNLRTNIKMATFLPVSEKPNLMYLFIKYDKAIETNNGEKLHSDPILITLTKDHILQQFHKTGVLDISITDFNACIDYMRKQAILTGFRISNPFVTNVGNEEIVQSFFVNCHRGTKEGSLYFLPDNILFGFRKPILLFDSSDIESITYSSITRLTFNVTLITKEGEKFEFSMIDQSEYTKIDQYVKRKQVIDKSMSEELKAKSKSKNPEGSSEDGPGALQEAAQQMEMEGPVDLNGADLDSEDNEENDGNFEAGSDLSDGSDNDDEDEDGSEDLDENEEQDEQEAEEEDEQEAEEENEQASLEFEEISAPTLQIQDIDMSNSLAEIPIEIGDEDEDEDGSGVEYE